MPSLAQLASTAETAVFRAVAGLPPRVQRLLNRRPVRIDGLTLAPDVQLVLNLQRWTREAGAETLPLAGGRAAILRQTRLAGGDLPVGEVRDLRVAQTPARLYVPTGAQTPGPLLVFLHGGGFIYGDLDSHDPACRFLAERAGVRVLSVDYRLAPEHRFPSAYDDSVAAFGWALEHAAELGADPDRIGVGGDSAGGNLAAGVALEAARRGWPCKAQLLVYPATAGRRTTRSAELFGRDLFLTTEFMQLATDSYSTGEVDLDDPRFAPSLAELSGDLAPAWVWTAGFDPLRDEGEDYARALAAAGTPVVQRRFEDQIHGFLNVLVARSCLAANTRIAADIGLALA